MNCVSLVILFPLMSFFILSFFQNNLSRYISSWIGIFSIFISTCFACYVALDYYYGGLTFYVKELFVWIHLDTLRIKFSFLLDYLSITMLVLVSIIGLIIHFFSLWYMQNKNDNARYFAYMSLFMAGMFLLILADNLLLMYFGWEIVGICSYLLIGFYYFNSKNCYFAMKSFLITRIGDIFILIAMFIIFHVFGTLNFQSLNLLSSSQLINKDIYLILILVFLLLGSVSKSAQFPLHTWLSDAMVGPSPVSALMHAATMITAGVYLILRMHYLFSLDSVILGIIGVFGMLSLVISGLSALCQIDIKKILAYSTMNQISYMFLALSVQAWHSAILHLISHAIFKALLFLSFGSIILQSHNEQNIFRLGGLKNRFPLLYIFSVIGGLSLSAFPIVTFGFYTKENILLALLRSHHILFLIIGLLFGLITSLYTFRMIFLVYHGTNLKLHNKFYTEKRFSLYGIIPMVLLSFFSTVCFVLILIYCNFSVSSVNGFIEIDKYLLSLISSAISIIGIIIAYNVWVKNISICKYDIYRRFSLLFFNGFYFDYIYNMVFKKLYIFIVRLLSVDPLGMVVNKITIILSCINKLLLITENGNIRWYSVSLMISLLFFLFSLILLNISIL
ncbi:MAG: NADH-quinone oxidoreductase subunit L [Buchnera aphidicola (Eriosoma harunire)]